MNTFVDVTRNPDGQELIPTQWRATIRCIVEAIKDGSLLAGGIKFLRPVSPERDVEIKASIASYGVVLSALPEGAWLTSKCQWMNGYWEVLVDLYSVEEGASDLVLALRVYEVPTGVEFEVQSVYVP